MRRYLLAAILILLPAYAGAATVGALLGQPVLNLQNERVGTVDELIIDVSGGRLVYVIVHDRGEFHTLPVRAFRGEQLRIAQMDLASAAARIDSADVRLRRAGRLIGQPVTQPGGGEVGAIADIEFDLASGEVQRVLVQTSEGRRGMPPAVLAHGRFPPLTQWQVEHPPAEVSGQPPERIKR